MPIRLQSMQRIFGAIIALSSLVTVPPLLIAWWLQESTQTAFAESLRSLSTRPTAESNTFCTRPRC